MPWKHWNWLDNGLLPLLLATLRACWLWPWLALLVSIFSPTFGQPPLGFIAIVALPLFSFASARWVADYVERTRPAGRRKSTGLPLWARLAVALLGLATILTVLWWQYVRTADALLDPARLVDLGYGLIRWGNELPPQLLTFSVAAYLWLRGMLDAARQLSHDDIWSTFMSGVFAWVLYLLITVIGGLTLEPNVTTLLLLFFALGMAGLALTSLKITVGLDRALGMGRDDGLRHPTLNRYWLVSVVVVIGVLVGLGALIGALVAPEMVARVLDLLGAVVGFIGYVIGQILLVIAYVMFMTAYFVATLLRPWLQRLLALLVGDRLAQEFGTPAPAPAREAQFSDPVVVPESYRWAALVVVVGVVVVIFALALRRLSAQRAEEVDEVRDSIFSAELLQGQLGALLNRWLGRLRGQGGIPFLALDGEPETRRAIRQIFQNLLQAAAEADQPRARARTPLQFASELGQRYQLHAQALTSIALAYLVARYSPTAPTQEVAVEVERMWTALQPALVRQPAEEHPSDLAAIRTEAAGDARVQDG